MVEFWLVRHGQTDWNKEKRFQGQRDLPLNNTGIEQALTLAASLKDHAFDVIYSSDLSRARQTAEILAGQVNAPLHLEPRLRERKYGIFEGCLYPEIDRRFPREAEARRKDPVHYTPPGGESLSDVVTRVTQAAADIAGHHPSGRILLVSHGLSLAMLICQARGLPLQQAVQYIPENAHPEVITWPGPPAPAERN